MPKRFMLQVTKKIVSFRKQEKKTGKYILALPTRYYYCMLCVYFVYLFAILSTCHVHLLHLPKKVTSHLTLTFFFDVTP